MKVIFVLTILTFASCNKAMKDATGVGAGGDSNSVILSLPDVASDEQEYMSHATVRAVAISCDRGKTPPKDDTQTIKLSESKTLSITLQNACSYTLSLSIGSDGSGKPNFAGSKMVTSSELRRSGGSLKIPIHITLTDAGQAIALLKDRYGDSNDYSDKIPKGDAAITGKITEATETAIKLSFNNAIHQITMTEQTTYYQKNGQKLETVDKASLVGKTYKVYGKILDNEIAATHIVSL